MHVGALAPPSYDLLFLLSSSERTETFSPAAVLNLDQTESVQLSSSYSIGFYFTTSRPFVFAPASALCLTLFRYTLVTGLDPATVLLLTGCDPSVKHVCMRRSQV